MINYRHIIIFLITACLCFAGFFIRHKQIERDTRQNKKDYELLRLRLDSIKVLKDSIMEHMRDSNDYYILKIKEIE